MKKSSQSPHVDTICVGLEAMGISYVCELRFDIVRKFRFDIALPEWKVAIEYEGIFKPRGGQSRHTTGFGYSRDCEKYNLAQIQGWKVLRYTALNYNNVYQDIHTLVNNLAR